jgi:hypothetical protein
MTTPPGGPYGQDSSGTNPYGQGPYWGGPQQGGPQQGGPQQGGSQQGGPPQGGQYPYPPGGPYPYPPPQFPQPGQQFPPGWPPGPYPGGPPPQGPRSKLPWLIIAGIAVLAVIALAVILVVNLGKENKPTKSTPSVTASAPTSPPANSKQTATDCTPNVSAGEEPSGDEVSAGALSFPASAAPGWTPFADNSLPNAIDAVGVAKEVPDAQQWVMQAEVAITNFVTSMDVAQQASKLMTCVSNGPGYADVSPTLGPTHTSSTTVDGIEAARVDADVTIGDTSRNVKGDSVTIIAVKTKPVTFFLGASPIGDADARATIDKVIGALKIRTT